MANKKKSFLSVFIKVFVAALIMTALVRPAMKFLYPLEYEDAILEYSDEFDLSEYIIMGVISSESGFDHAAESHKEAKGLMQLKEETAIWCIENLNLDVDKEKIFDPTENIHIGCAYLAYLEKMYNGNMTTALAAYNAGLGNVNKWLADPKHSDKDGTLKDIPFEETKKYVQKVKKRADIYRTLYGNEDLSAKDR